VRSTEVTGGLAAMIATNAALIVSHCRRKTKINPQTSNGKVTKMGTGQLADCARGIKMEPRDDVITRA
jgi:hypothetical protein